MVAITIVEQARLGVHELPGKRASNTNAPDDTLSGFSLGAWKPNASLPVHVQRRSPVAGPSTTRTVAAVWQGRACRGIEARPAAPSVET